jgi:molecular chaperone DnaK
VGAVLQAGIITGDEGVTDVLLLDVTPLTLGIETLGGIMTTMIERNTTIPSRRSETFSTAADNQPAVEVHVLQGEREFSKDNVTLGRFHLMGIPPAPRGMPQIEVTFDIDANGIVNVSAKDLGTGTEQSIKIESQTSLSEDDISAKIAEAEEFASEDKRRKAAVTLINSADSMVYQATRMLKEAGEKLSDLDSEPIDAKLEELRSLITKDDQTISVDDLDEAAVQAKMAEVEEALHGVSSKLYEAAAAEMSEQDSDGDEEVVEADFEVVDSDEENE